MAASGSLPVWQSAGILAKASLRAITEGDASVVLSLFIYVGVSDFRQWRPDICVFMSTVSERLMILIVIDLSSPHSPSLLLLLHPHLDTLIRHNDNSYYVSWAIWWLRSIHVLTKFLPKSSVNFMKKFSFL